MNSLISGMRRSSVVLFWVLLAVGALLRLLWLDRASYMIDEINVIQFALQEKSWFSAYETELERFQFMHRMPMLVILIRAAVKTFTYTTAFPPEWIPRLPFALLGIATLPLIFGLGRRLGGERAGLLAMFLVTFSPFHLFYSREAYDYAMVMFFAAGTLWAALELVRAEFATGRLPGRRIVIFELLAIGLLHAHLSGLIFLTCVGGGLAIMLLKTRGLAALWREKRFWPWVFVMALPLVFFLPFLLKMAGGGWVDQESTTATRVTWAVVPGLLGRMGWGEAWWALLPFSAVMVAGLWTVTRDRDVVERRVGLTLVWICVVYLVLQTWMLRFGRFETRYYSSVFPGLLTLAAVGCAALADRLAARIKMPPVRLVAAGCAGLGLWLGVNAWGVVSLDCRGYNYKGLAKWLAEHLPENGIYSYWNVYDGRGVPAVYPVPGRHMAYPVAWSNEKDYIQLGVRDRLIRFFQRFPNAVYVETAPADLLQPDKLTNEPLPRGQLFMQQLWLEDSWAQRLIRWKTHPFGDAQWFGAHMDKWLVSYNRPEDLPALARQQRRVLYHQFGKEWIYRKDPQANDWLTTEVGGTFQVGNVSDTTVQADIRFAAFAYPAGCQVNVYGSSTGQVLSAVQISSQPREIRLPPQTLAPGTTEYFIEVTPPADGSKALFLLYQVSAAPIAPPG